jgi:hypothetical protein
VVLPPGSVDIDNSLEIDFPSEWDMIINYKLPECHVYNEDNILALRCAELNGLLIIMFEFWKPDNYDILVD